MGQWRSSEKNCQQKKIQQEYEHKIGLAIEKYGEAMLKVDQEYTKAVDEANIERIEAIRRMKESAQIEAATIQIEPLKKVEKFLESEGE